jgi:hypothetical protein
VSQSTSLDSFQENPRASEEARMQNQASSVADILQLPLGTESHLALKAIEAVF